MGDGHTMACDRDDSHVFYIEDIQLFNMYVIMIFDHIDKEGGKTWILMKWI